MMTVQQCEQGELGARAQPGELTLPADPLGLAPARQGQRAHAAHLGRQRPNGAQAMSLPVRQ